MVGHILKSYPLPWLGLGALFCCGSGGAGWGVSFSLSGFSLENFTPMTL
ncbi:hypothetical protein FTV88_1364 [Heliorestis convoluta]|uniref:Uncharacterized protein n=1 Tax=Heliorestis convoluta TaxID=356322 RepID=A0A5Q2MZP4_9FIRM|nr:hypothetical protein FTV88_1364 [Heliorestis convoluta]